MGSNTDVARSATAEETISVIKALIQLSKMDSAFFEACRRQGNWKKGLTFFYQMCTLLLKQLDFKKFFLSYNAESSSYTLVDWLIRDSNIACMSYRDLNSEVFYNNYEYELSYFEDYEIGGTEVNLLELLSYEILGSEDCSAISPICNHKCRNCFNRKNCFKQSGSCDGYDGISLVIWKALEDIMDGVMCPDTPETQEFYHIQWDIIDAVENEFLRDGSNTDLSESSRFELVSLMIRLFCHGLQSEDYRLTYTYSVVACPNAKKVLELPKDGPYGEVFKVIADGYQELCESLKLQASTFLNQLAQLADEEQRYAYKDSLTFWCETDTDIFICISNTYDMGDSAEISRMYTECIVSQQLIASVMCMLLQIGNHYYKKLQDNV